MHSYSVVGILSSMAMLFVLAQPPELQCQDLSTLSSPLTSIDGSIGAVASIGKGTVTVVIFWLSNCNPSKRQMAAMELLSQKYGGSVTFIGVAIDNTKTLARARSLAGKYGMPVLFDPEQELFSIVNGTEHPYTLIYNADGQLAARHSGFFEGDEVAIDQEIMALLPDSGTPDQ